MAKINSEQVLALSKLINEFVKSLENDYVDILKELSTKSFKDGLSNARKHGMRLKPADKDAIKSHVSSVTSQLEDRIEPVIVSIKKDLMNTLRECANKNYSYDKTKEILSKRVEYLDEHIPFDARGQTYTKPDIVNGVLIESKHTVTKPKTLSTDTYFNMLSQSVGKRAYLMAKTASYQNNGYSSVIYRSKRDNKVRKTHKAMNGKSTKINSDTYKLFVELLLEYGCRCDLVPKK